MVRRFGKPTLAAIDGEGKEHCRIGYDKGNCPAAGAISQGSARKQQQFRWHS